MILYSDRDDHYSQRVRIVLAEKDITAEIKESKPEETPEDILSISPYHKLPILVDRDLAIHDPSVMMEYLDERFPHPPLLPVYPVARANSRTLMLRSDEFTLVDCCFAPILWRLPSIGIRLPVNRHLKPLIDYQKEIFKRPGFLDSLSSLERDLKED